MDGSAIDERSKRLVELSPEADLDLSGIHTYTTSRHGLIQARSYIAFLQEVMISAANSAAIGRPVELRPGLFVALAPWPGSQASHRIIFQRTLEGIYVLRILHTAMDLLRHIELTE